MMRVDTLLTSFAAHRSELRRYFAARVGETDADDVVQEIWLKIAVHDHATDIGNPRAYLYRIGVNILHDRVRQERSRSARDAGWRDAHATLSPAGEAIADEVPIDRALIARERLERMAEALGDLPDTVRRAFCLHKLDGLTQAEVAAAMGVSKSMVEKHMARALHHLVRRVGG